MAAYDQSLAKNVLMTIITMSVALCGSFYLRRRYKYIIEYNRLSILRQARIMEKRENLCKLSAELDEQQMSDNYVNKVVEKSLEDLLKFLRSGVQSPEQVLVAYQKKAMAVHSRLNCIVEFVDIDWSEINKNGPLFGLPVSVKDNFLIKGYPSCAGCSYFLDKEVRTNSVLIDVLKDLGAVPFVKTIVPQTMMSILSSNPIDGMTLNPVNTKMSPGGSSSGEAALIADEGSIVGIGTDIGGSVRLPAAFCGVVGFKPTVGRLSKKGLLEITAYPVVTGACGVLGRNVTAVSYLYKHIINSKLHRRLDPTVVPSDFNSEIYYSRNKLRIGYFVFDGSFHVVPAVKRAVLQTVDRLRRNGHELVEWRMPVAGDRLLTLFLTAIAIGKGNNITKVCEYDELDSTVKHLMDILNWNWFQYLYYLTTCTLFGNKDMNIWVKATRSVNTATEVMKLKSDIKVVRDQFLCELTTHNIDVLICPTSGFVALPARPKGSTTGMLTYQNVWNLIDFPAGTVPVSRVTQADINYLVDNYPRSTSMWHNNTFEDSSIKSLDKSEFVTACTEDLESHYYICIIFTNQTK